MGRELTTRHSVLFERRVPNPLLFARDIYRYGKFRELVSFVVWELLHRLRLFPRTKYLDFNSGEALTLDGVSLTGNDFLDKVERFFRSRGLSASRCEHNWKLLFTNNRGEMFGSIYPEDRDLYKSIDGGQSVVFIKKFPERIKSIFISKQNTLFVCVKGAVYKSSDGGGSFKKSLELGSPESFFRHNNEMTETPDNTLIIGEYGNIWDKRGWRKLAFLYFSTDEGETWNRSDFLIRMGTNKHVHLVKYSRLFDKVFMADGDNYKKVWVSPKLNSANSIDPELWKPVNRFHIQMGGYTSVVENDVSLLFGTDYQGGTNFIVETRDGETFDKKIVPDPYRRSPINNMVLRQSKNGNEIWASLPYSTAGTKSLLMYSADGGESWNKVFEYRKASHNVSLISSSNDMLDEIYLSVFNKDNNERVVFKIAD